VGAAPGWSRRPRPTDAGTHQHQPLRSRTKGQVQVRDADILALDYANYSFDVVVAEAVMMFADRPRAAAELRRGTRPAGQVLPTQNYGRHPPTTQAKQLYSGEVWPGSRFDSIQEWAGIDSQAGLIDICAKSGPFAMMTTAAEGRHALAVIALETSLPASLQKMAWLWPRMSQAVPNLGELLVARKSEPSASGRA
jgi:SAM-dependent methyltransferase